MSRKIIYGIVLLVGLLVGNTLSAQELWFEYGISHKTWGNLTTKIEAQHRFVDVGKLNNYKNCFEVTLQYRISPMFKLSGSYRFANQINYVNITEKEGEIGKQRYCIDLNIDFPLTSKILSFENRFRYQIALKNNEDVKRFYRNKTTLGVKIDKKTDFAFSDELYYNITKNKLDLNRVSMGIERELSKKIVFDFLFHIETDRENRSFSNNYIISTGLFYKL